MGQATFSVRMDESLKRQFDEFEISSPASKITRDGAMQAFMELRKQVVQNGVADMSLDEINEEISLTRKKANN